MGTIEKIPTFLTVSILVILFVHLRRYARSARLTLWAVGWALVFTHFLAQLLEPAKGRVIPLLLALDLGALQAAAIAFLVSVSSVVEDYGKRLTLFLILVVPSVTFAVLTCYSVQARWLYVACLALSFGGGACFFFFVHREFTAYLVIMTLLSGCVAAWAGRAAIHGSFDEGTTALLGIGFGLPAVFICRNYWRASPAILTISGGFFCWGLVFPLGMLIHRFAPHANIPGELWNTPKLFVAFGMILAIVEDKSESVTSMQHNAEALNAQLQRFSEITSRLLSGAPAEAMCAEIAAAITDVSGFIAAEIYLEDSERKLRLVGASYTTGEHPRLGKGTLRQWTTDAIKNFCLTAPHRAQNSFVLQNPKPLNAEDALLIPLRSAGGGCLGCIRLEPAAEGRRLPCDEVARLESLAADLAVAVELKALHKQLVWSEKLAGLGQLVAGVAHELNNPLAVIMGYGELLGDEVSSARHRDQLHKIVAESRRMKKIIANLLRFSRQSGADVQSVQFAPVLQEVLSLREYYLRTHNVRVELEVPADLAPVAINEDEIKQILLNLLNNSSDALESVTGEKRICVRASDDGKRVRVEVEDSGPGFANLSRALDPFYTTKPVGKGTGLGLSVCYGIVKERGGDLRIENVSPQGARVFIELPAASAVAPPLAMAVAHA